MPLLVAGIWTILLGRHGFLNTNGSLLSGIFNGVVVLHAITSPLQHLTVVVGEMFEGRNKMKSARSGELHSSASELSSEISRVKARFSEDEKDMFWAGEDLGASDHGRAVELANVPLPEVQGRPSTRKRG